MERKRALRLLGFGIPVLLALVVVFAVAVSSRPRREGRAGGSSASSGVVTKVGENVVLEVEGYGRLQLAGVEVPEHRDMQKVMQQVEHYGLPASRVRALSAEASRVAREKVLNRTVAVELRDERADASGVRRAYIHLLPERTSTAPEAGGEAPDVGLMLIEAGAAFADRTAEHPRLDRYTEAEALAHAARRGMWKETSK